MNVDVRRHGFVNERTETEPKVGGVLGHAQSQSNTDRLQLQSAEKPKKKRPGVKSFKSITTTLDSYTYVIQVFLHRCGYINQVVQIHRITLELLHLHDNAGLRTLIDTHQKPN